MDWSLARTWGWRAGLLALVLFMLLRLLALSREARAAGNRCSTSAELAKQRSAGATWASANRGDGEPAVVYTLNVITGDATATHAIEVKTTRSARVTTAVPLMMIETPASAALVADLAVQRTRFLLIEGRVWGPREWDWAVPGNNEDRMAVGELSDSQLHRAWLVAAEDGADGAEGGSANSFPLGEPVQAGDLGGRDPVTAAEGQSENGWTRCYALGL
jgi:hypothetical protein